MVHVPLDNLWNGHVGRVSFHLQQDYAASGLAVCSTISHLLSFASMNISS